VGGWEDSASMSDEVILATENLTKEFAGFVAVNGVDLKVTRGTIHALIGPNGAGKTTCFNLLTKFLRPTRGRIVYNGRDITTMAPADVARLGLVRSFQISAVFPHLTVLENVRIALHVSAARPMISGVRSGCSTPQRTRAGADRRRRSDGIRARAGSRAALRQETRAGNRHHLGARSRHVVVGRTHGRHGA
jgi:ABC-type branched-chain amino acid transport systems, ATPase component